MGAVSFRMTMPLSIRHKGSDKYENYVLWPLQSVDLNPTEPLWETVDQNTKISFEESLQYSFKEL